jgi:hypothetical protein
MKVYDISRSLVAESCIKKGINRSSHQGNNEYVLLENITPVTLERALQVHIRYCIVE